MEFVENTTQQFDNVVGNFMETMVGNEYISTILSLFLILYAALAAPALPEYVANLFRNPIVQFVLLFLIAYSARKNPTFAAISSVVFMVTLHTINRYDLMNMARDTRNDIMNRMMMEGFEEAEADEEEDDDADMEEGAMTETVPEESLGEVEGETVKDCGCVKKSNFRNNFYPQYVNLKPDAYMARYTGNEVSGYDTAATYAQT